MYKLYIYPSLVLQEYPIFCDIYHQWDIHGGLYDSSIYIYPISQINVPNFEPVPASAIDDPLMIRQETCPSVGRFNTVGRHSTWLWQETRIFWGKSTRVHID